MAKRKLGITHTPKDVDRVIQESLGGHIGQVKLRGVFCQAVCSCSYVGSLQRFRYIAGQDLERHYDVVYSNTPSKRQYNVSKKQWLGS